MRLVPERISAAWIGTLTDDDLVDVEARLHARFVDLERREKKSRAANMIPGFTTSPPAVTVGGSQRPETTA